MNTRKQTLTPTKKQTLYSEIDEKQKCQLQQTHYTIFSQMNVMDYFTLEGIENRISVEKENVFAFAMEELMDNAVDFLETLNSVFDCCPKIDHHSCNKRRPEF
jgi:hypothetical protein